MKLQKQPDGELLEGFLFSFFCLFCIASMGVKRSLPQTPMGTDTKLCHSLQSKDWEEEPCRSELSWSYLLYSKHIQQKKFQLLLSSWVLQRLWQGALWTTVPWIKQRIAMRWYLIPFQLDNGEVLWRERSWRKQFLNRCMKSEQLIC